MKYVAWAKGTQGGARLWRNGGNIKLVAMRTLGKALQVLALVVLPLSMLLQMTNMLGRQLHVSEMVWMLAFGVCAFLLGRLVEGYAR